MTRAAARFLEAYLVVSAQAGDRAAFAQLVARWHRRLLGDQEAAADAVQQRALGATLANEADGLVPPDDGGIDAARLHRAFRSQPADQRAAIALFHLEEMSVAEVAVALDVPVGTVKTRLMHARRKLRMTLEGVDT